MFKATLASVLAHKLRLALTGIAIVLGVAFMAAALILTDTATRTFDNLFQQVATGKDVIVQGVNPYGKSTSGIGFGGNSRPDVPETLVSTIKGVPGVRDAAGVVDGMVTLILPNGKALSKSGPPVIGTGWTNDAALGSLKIQSGRGPASADEFTIDLSTYNSKHLSLGEQLTIIGNQSPKKFTLVGTTKFGSDTSLAGATVLSFVSPEAQQLFGRPGYFTEIAVSDQSGTNPDAVIAAVGAVLPSGYEAITGAQNAQQMASTLNRFIGYFRDALLAFALIALFVGAFLISNTFNILIGQRTRELALLRAMGASRRQVTLSMIGEALIVGIVGSAVGLGLGIPLAIGLQSLLRAFGFSPPAQGLEILARTIIVCLVVGTLITLISSVGPAVRSSRIPPVAAMRDDAVILQTSLRRRATVGSIFFGLGLLLLLGGLFGGVKSPVPLVGAGAALAFIGIATLAPFVAGPIAHALGAPGAALRGVTGRLGQENATRSPRRTAATASALMVGVGVVATIATLGASASASFGNVVKKALTSSYVLNTGSQGSGFPNATVADVQHAQGVTAVSPFAEVNFHIRNTRKTAGVIDAATGNQVFRIQMLSGSYDTLARGEVLMADATAKSDHVTVGDVLPMSFTQTGTHSLTVGGIYKANDFLDNYLIDYGVATTLNGQAPPDEALFVKTSSTGPAEAAILTSALSAYPQIKIQTNAEFESSQQKQFSSMLAVIYVLLALSIIIAAFSVVNTMALSVIERTHEIGLVRSVGMQRRQVKGMVRAEAVIVSLLGAIMGLVIGLLLGSAIVEAIASSSSGSPFHLALPIPTGIVVLILAALIGIIAAVFPARRAARLDVLKAISAV